MSDFKTPDPFSDEPLSDPEDDFPEELKRIFSKSKVPLNVQTYLYPIDESEEFHDPFSDLSLFLAKKVKKQLLQKPDAKSWSHNIERTILNEILPEFKRKFPKYRLGGNALKTTFEKVSHYLNFANRQKDAFQSNGKLNTRLMISENLKDTFEHKTEENTHPYTTTHNLAIKISECIAALDAERPNIDELMQTIWAVQKHLLEKLPGEKCPFEKYKGLDRLIVRKQLEILADSPLISQKTLADRTEKAILSIKQLSRIRNIYELSPIISSLLAEKLYPFSEVHKRLDKSNVEKILSFIQTQIAKEFAKKTHIETSDYLTVVRRILFVCKIAHELTEERAEKGLKAAIEYVYSLSSGNFTPTGPALKQEMYHFIRTEIMQAKKDKLDRPLESILETLMNIFYDAKKLPPIDDETFPSLEIMTWKVLFEELHLLKKLPFYLKEIVNEELANVHIDHSNLSFEEIVEKTLFHLKKLKEIDTTDLKQKIFDWSIQGDMIASLLHFDESTPLMTFLQKTIEVHNHPNSNYSHLWIIEKTLENFLTAHPKLTKWRKQIKTRISILYKHAWYKKLRKKGESSFDRFLKWHHYTLAHQKEQVFPEMKIMQLEDICKKVLPLTPILKGKSRSICWSEAKSHVS